MELVAESGYLSVSETLEDARIGVKKVPRRESRRGCGELKVWMRGGEARSPISNVWIGAGDSRIDKSDVWICTGDAGMSEEKVWTSGGARRLRGRTVWAGVVLILINTFPLPHPLPHPLPALEGDGAAHGTKPTKPRDRVREREREERGLVLRMRSTPVWAAVGAAEGKRASRGCRGPTDPRSDLHPPAQPRSRSRRARPSARFCTARAPWGRWLAWSRPTLEHRPPPRSLADPTVEPHHRPCPAPVVLLST